MKKSIIQLILIHFKEFMREPGIWLWAIIFPVAMAWVLGAAFTSKETLNQKIGVIKLKQIQNATFNKFIHSANKVNGELQKTVDYESFGKVNYHLIDVNWNDAILSLKRGIFTVLIGEKDGKLEFHFDPKNADAKLTYLQISKSIAGEEKIASSGTSILPLTQIGTRYIDFLIPGLLALGLMNSFIWGVSYSLIEMRTKKLLRRMVATPMLKSDFIISHYVARIALSVVESAILFFFAKFFFQTHIEGSISAFFLVFFSGTIAFTGISVWVASRTASMRVAHGLMNAITMPSMILSGIFFSYHNFPDVVVQFIKFLPLTLIADNLRSVFNEGAGLPQVITPSIILIATGLVTFGIGLKTYKWY